MKNDELFEVAIVDWSSTGLVVCDTDEFWAAEDAEQITNNGSVGDVLVKLGIDALHIFINSDAIELANSKGELIFRHSQGDAEDVAEWTKLDWNLSANNFLEGARLYQSKLVRDSAILPATFKKEFAVWKGGWFEFEMSSEELRALLVQQGFQVTVNTASW